MNRAAVVMALGVLALAVFAAAPFFGLQPISLDALGSDPQSTSSLVFWKLRVPRVCLAMLAGAALSLGGMTFQGMFRNPLATPFTLGVASGAALGAVAAIRLGFTFTMDFVVFRLGGTSLAALAGALLSILLVYGITRSKRGFSTPTMLLAGVALSFFFSALILLIQYLSDFTQTFRMIRWVMGGLQSSAGFDAVLGLLPLAVAGGLILAFHTRELNLLATGEELARSRGVEVTRTKKLLFFAASLMVGGVVAVCGPIAFVGLIVPHICRLLVGSDHRLLLPATVLFGGAFLTLCDTVARSIMPPAELPVGILTALLGGPFFLWLLLARQGEV